VYRRFLGVSGWIGIPAGLLVLATLACDERQAPQGPRPVAPAEPLRIVSLSPELSRLIVEFGLASQIVGVDSASHSIPELTSAADLGELETADATVIAALKPDFVFALGEDSKLSFAAALRERGLALHVLNPTDANDVIQSIRELGIIVGREDRAQSAVRQLTEEISEIATERDGKNRLSVAWVLQRDPLIIVGNRGLLHQILELAGGEIALHRLQGERIEVSFEVLAASNPDLILDSTPKSRHEPIAMGVRTEVPPTSVSELPALDLLGRIQIIHRLLYPPQSAGKLQ
jgi:ABC-type Fe3+-hydroxamate transport system substrate-binding protein